MYKFLGIGVCTPLLSAAGFFGPQWIEVGINGLNIHANGVETAVILNEWCMVCKQQCVVDHELKNKLSINLENIQCDDFISTLPSTIDFERVSNQWVFRKKSKGDWLAFQCVNRLPTEIANSLRQVLSTSVKQEHLMADNLSSQLWIPKAFYEHHIEMIQKLDVPKAVYRAHLFWVVLNVSQVELIRLDPSVYKVAQQWLHGKSVVMSASEVASWLSGLAKSGEITIISDTNIIITEGEETEVKLQEWVVGKKPDKKGNLQIAQIPRGVWLKLIGWKSQQRMMLDVTLEDRQGVESPIFEQNEIMLKIKTPVEADQSFWLGGLARKVTKLEERCIPFLGKVPLIKRLFCSKKTEAQDKQYALILSIEKLL